MKYTLYVNFDYSTVPTNFFCMKIYFNYKTIDFYWYESFEYIFRFNICFSNQSIESKILFEYGTLN